jgi:transcriptional regulator GlxA family with amidase domain
MLSGEPMTGIGYHGPAPRTARGTPDLDALRSVRGSVPLRDLEIPVKIAILLYEGMTALDAIGPYEVLSHLPDAEVCFTAEKKGLVCTETGFLRLSADYALSEVSEADILLVPGGPGDRGVQQSPSVLDWIRLIHEQTRFTTSVCTGSLILGAAGLLKDLRATTHWARMDVLRELGAVPVSERIVEQGKIITAAGVSAGIDMALRLVQKISGDDYAQAVQLGIEYDPQPPFDSGSPSKAPSHIVELVKRVMESESNG